MTPGSPNPAFASLRPGVVEIPPTSEPLDRNWSAALALFRIDRDALRRRDYQACSALEMAEAMDRFLAMAPRG